MDIVASFSVLLDLGQGQNNLEGHRLRLLYRRDGLQGREEGQESHRKCGREGSSGGELGTAQDP